jgi:arabinoxylan arabinofuranohydrolase
MVSDDPLAGWSYTGTILQQPEQNNGNNNHHSMVEYQGAWYIFYHNRVLANREGRSSFQRSITLDHLAYDAQGNINLVPSQRGLVRQLRSVDAFARIEAEAMADQRGIETQFAVDGSTRVGVSVTELQNGDWIGYSQLDFGAGASLFRARVAGGAGGTLQVRVDGCNDFTRAPGIEVGSCTVLPNGAGTGASGAPAWADVECAVSVSAGVHDVCLSFAGAADAALFDLDYFSFE